MRRLLTLAVLSSVAFAQGASPAASPVEPATPNRQQEARMDTDVNMLPDLPPLPQGKSTVIGGRISNVDRVRDRLIIAVFGGGKIRVFFDERTQVYRDGLRASLHDLSNGEHVSVETVLDGTNLFAPTIHLLTRSGEGQCSGQVLDFDRGRGELVVRDNLSPEPIRLRVSAETAIAREGQAVSSFAELRPGALVNVSFRPGSEGRAVARRIAILADPGASFVFTGSVIFLDLHSGLLVMVDPRDSQHYEISFDPSHFPVSRDLHLGTDITVHAGFDGKRYSANEIVVNSQSAKQME